MMIELLNILDFRYNDCQSAIIFFYSHSSAKCNHSYSPTFSKIQKHRSNLTEIKILVPHYICTNEHFSTQIRKRSFQAYQYPLSCIISITAKPKQLLITRLLLHQRSKSQRRGQLVVGPTLLNYIVNRCTELMFVSRTIHYKLRRRPSLYQHRGQRRHHRILVLFYHQTVKNPLSLGLILDFDLTNRRLIRFRPETHLNFRLFRLRLFQKGFKLLIWSDNFILAILFLKDALLLIRIWVILAKSSKIKRLILIRYSPELLGFSLVILAEVIDLPYQIRKLFVGYFFAGIQGEGEDFVFEDFINNIVRHDFFEVYSLQRGVFLNFYSLASTNLYKTLSFSSFSFFLNLSWIILLILLIDFLSLAKK